MPEGKVIMKKSNSIYEGKIRRDVFGSWDDCSPGLYLDHDMITTIFSEMLGKHVRVTIEEIEAPEEDSI